MYQTYQSLSPFRDLSKFPWSLLSSIKGKKSLSDLLNHPVEVLRSRLKLSPGNSEYLFSLPVLSTCAILSSGPEGNKVPHELLSYLSHRINALLIPSKSCLPPTPTSAPLREVCWWLEMKASKNMTFNSHLPRNLLYPRKSGKYSNCHLYVSGNIIKNRRILSKGIQNYHSFNKYLSDHHVQGAVPGAETVVLVPKEFP